MGIGDTITRNMTESAVYWGTPIEDGYGGQTFDEPIEISCRWEDKEQIIGTITGNQIVGFQEMSRAIVYVDRDLDIDGVLMRGTLADLEDSSDSSGSYYIPAENAGAYIIKRFEKTPALGSSTVYIRQAYLTPWLT
jgi:hypothetical protein